MDIETTSRLAGQFCWVETQLFEILGAWLHDGAFDADDVVRIGERCTRHGEHAEAWRSRVATIPSVDTDALIAPSPAHVMLIAELRDTRHAANVRLVTYDDAVTSHLVPEYEHLRGRIDAALDGPTARLLDRAVVALTAPLAR